MNQDSSLAPIWVVGFTGHRFLRDPEKVGRLLQELLGSLREQIPGHLVGYSSVAIGGDTLFAEACLSCGIPWTALLPRPESDFKSDFNAAEWEKTHALLQQAARVQSLPEAEDRTVSYLECGLSTVEEADLVIAVWDGKPSRGVGGTAEVVAHTRNLAKPLILIDPDRLTIERENFSLELFSDAEMGYLDQLPNRDDVTGDLSVTPEERLRQYFRKVDAQAAHIAPRFRGWVAASVILNALSAILVAASVAYNYNLFWFNAVIFILMGAAMLSIAFIKRKGAHRKWIRCRVAAEICRSALATWSLGEVATPFWFSQIEGFGRLAKSIRLLHWIEGERPPVNVAAWRQNYLTSRVDQQINYFRRHRQRVATALSLFNWSFWIFSGLGTGRFIFTFLVPVRQSNFLAWCTLQSFLPIALPLAAGCALSLISIFDLSRQVARSKAMEASLQAARSQIEKCESLSSLRRAVENTENAFAGEFFEWFTLFRYPRFN